MHIQDTLPPVVVTRPIAQARLIEKKIAALGRQVIVFPLLEISALEDNATLDAALQDLSRYVLVAFVSPNAIDAAFARRPLWPTTVRLAVMGEGSRQALAAHGVTEATHQIFSPVDVERTDSETLLAALDVSTFAGKNVLIVRGDSGRELLADALREAGTIVTQVAAYRRAAPVIDADGLLRLQQLLNRHCEWVVTSSEALRILLHWVRQLDQLSGADNCLATPASGSFIAILQQQTLLVPHVRIAETATALGFCNIVRTASGDSGLLAALQFRHE